MDLCVYGSIKKHVRVMDGRIGRQFFNTLEVHAKSGVQMRGYPARANATKSASHGPKGGMRPLGCNRKRPSCV